jgi:hypothetical protein
MVRRWQFSNASLPKLRTLPGIVTLTRLVHSANAFPWMLVTLLGIVMLVSALFPKAEIPMLVTGRPLIVPG